MKKGIILIVSTALLCSYISFKLIKEFSNNERLYYVKWYNLFIPYEKKISTYSEINSLIDIQIIKKINEDINNYLRPRIIMWTIFSILLSFYPAYKIYKRNQIKEKIKQSIILNEFDENKNQTFHRNGVLESQGEFKDWQKMANGNIGMKLVL